MELGQKIRQLRFKAKLTQEQLADKLSIAPQSVSKWENGAAMPDITTLPRLAEIFGVSIDDLFDLTAEQRFNRIENRMDAEEELPRDVFMEYEEFLLSQLTSSEHKKRAGELISYLYWHRMNSYAQKVCKYAKDAVRLSPGEKTCYWELGQAENHAVWDWNMANHTKAIDFYKELVEKNPEVRLPYLYLLDNLIADRRSNEAEAVLQKLSALPDADPTMTEVYRAHIALARFDEKTADRIIEELVEKDPDNFVGLFEAAQYHARKCDYEKALALYERSFEKEPRRPRFTDELYAIAQIHEIRGSFAEAAKTYDRIVVLLQNEWGLTEKTDTAVTQAKNEKARLLEKARKKE